MQVLCTRFFFIQFPDCWDHETTIRVLNTYNVPQLARYLKVHNIILPKDEHCALWTSWKTNKYFTINTQTEHLGIIYIDGKMCLIGILHHFLSIWIETPELLHRGETQNFYRFERGFKINPIIKDNSPTRYIHLDIVRRVQTLTIAKFSKVPIHRYVIAVHKIKNIWNIEKNELTSIDCASFFTKQ